MYGKEILILSYNGLLEDIRNPRHGYLPGQTK